MHSRNVCICSRSISIYIYIYMHVYTCVFYRFGQRQVHGCKRAGAREAAPSGWIHIYTTFCMRACGGYIGIYILGYIWRYRHIYPGLSPYPIHGYIWRYPWISASGALWLYNNIYTNIYNLKLVALAHEKPWALGTH